MKKRNPFKKLLKISLKSAMFISLPIMILVCWMVADSYLEYRRFVTIACKGKAPSFNLDIMHFYLRNGIKRAYIRATAPEMPEDETLPTIQMAIDSENLAALNADLPQSGKKKYYKAYMKYNGKSYTVKARYRGGGYWHWLYPQKSWRIKTKKKKLIEGLRRINIVNPKSVLSFEESLSMDLAKKIGLMAPKCFSVKFVLNNQYMGLYYFWEQVGESLIRRYKRMPGNIYSDNSDKYPLGLWEDEKNWKKVGSRNAEEKNNRGDIQLLLKAINEFNLPDFYQFVKQHIDIENFALYAAFDNITGCSHHDFVHNHKLYFDPIVAKFMFIPWDVHLWHTPNQVKMDAGNPLLNKWKLIPVLDMIRHKTLWELLNKQLPEKELQNLLTNYFEKVYAALDADRFKDSLDTRPRSLLKFSAIGISVLDMQAFIKKYKHYQKIISKRNIFLKAYLSNDILHYSLIHNPKNILLKIISAGNVGSRLTSIKIRGQGDHLSIYRDYNRNSLLDDNDTLVGEGNFKQGECKIDLNELILPGCKLVKNINPSNAFGNYHMKPSGIEYPYILTGNIIIDDLTVSSVNIITGMPSKTIDNHIPENIVSNTASLHPWYLQREPETTTVTLGPGEVVISKSIEYPEHVSVNIAPGTTIRLGQDVSIISYGRVSAKGTPRKPIQFISFNKKKQWGVFALQGKAASGSIFEYCTWENGSTDRHEMIDYSGMVSIHEVNNLTIRNCRVSKNHHGDDAMHLAYCNNFSIEGCFFVDAESDALDIDISDGKVISSRFYKSGNDALDLMTSNVKIKECIFMYAGDKGVSIGEKSDVSLEKCAFEKCNIGVAVKDNSTVDFGNNVITESSTAINLYKKNWRYESGGMLKADTIYSINCEKNLEVDKHSNVQYNFIKTAKPDLMIWRKDLDEAGALAPTAK
ncbi:CotH kinase family protein [Desulfococcaceae bacterium HSG7]|nr:CotH kinase family protein [Desulfococcaceae bacterium HSG7]